MDTSGFYKLIDNVLHWGYNAVLAPDYQLYREQKDTYELPFDDWYWFDSEEEAKTFFGITDPEPETPQP